ncbi:hypothetical protein AVEN_159527-1 [Araneus ventricosus]|uniref:Uncharacterized protein n=1 Tax=Araneus ventricosus TaxID=182803 RepID=A0A4Y2NFT7_ARAVE|nr:hypothetical protein AVEN_159527-1 [Araneus ventricosus]
MDENSLFEISKLFFSDSPTRCLSATDISDRPPPSCHAIEQKSPLYSSRHCASHPFTWDSEIVTGRNFNQNLAYMSARGSADVALGDALWDT